MQYRYLCTQDNLSSTKPDAWKCQIPTNEDQAFLSIEKEPKTLKEAKNLPAANEWQKAMKDELQQLKELGTFTMADLPEGRKAVGSKWVYRLKIDNKGDVSQCKVRLVAQGYSQVPSIDFNLNQISLPVVRMETN
jgi:Reverse transcriptase (RNA-dependent DNA polymerase)